MKKLIMAAIVVASLCLSNAASAAGVVITTGQQGLAGQSRQGGQRYRADRFHPS